MENTKKKVAVILGSDSDLPVMLGCLKTLIQYQIPYEIHIISAHRTPETAAVFSSSARENGFGVLIAAAGKAAHLAGFLAAHTTLPVIAVPIKSSTLDGLDALLSSVQMPKGVPVATVAIDGGAIRRSRSSLVDQRQFGILKGHIARLMRETKAALTGGAIECDPFAGACEFCDFHRLCRFDPTNGHDAFREAAPLRKDEFFARHAGDEMEV